MSVRASSVSAQSITERREQMALSQRQRLREKQTYARTRARTCMQLLQEDKSSWQPQGAKGGIELFKSKSAMWKDVRTARAVTAIASTMPRVVKALLDSASSSARFQHFWQSVFSTTFVHAEVIEDLCVSPISDQRATAKWYALRPSKLRRPNDYFVIEWIGITRDEASNITACYLFQESIADVGALEKATNLPAISFERDHLASLLVKFEPTPDAIRISLVVQKPQGLLEFPFGASPAVDFAFQFAKGLRGALETPGQPPARPRACHHCAKAFHAFNRGRTSCASCHHIICQRAACAVTCPIPTLPELPSPVAESPRPFRCASAWSIHMDLNAAVRAAWQEITDKLDASTNISLLIVHYSPHVNAELVQAVLHQVAPNVPYIGGSIGRGLCDNEAWVAPSKRIVALFGIYDPEGSYSIGHAAYDSAATALCHVTALRHNRPTPDVCLVFATPLFMDAAMAALQGLFVVGGGATDAKGHAWNQISSTRNEPTINGLVAAFCSPSVIIERCWFSGYSFIDEEVKTVTQVDETLTKVVTIDNEAAASVYAGWLGSTRWSSFPRVGNLHPLALFDDTNDDEYVTRVVVGADDGVLELSNIVSVGVQVRVMELSKESMTTAMGKWGDQIKAMPGVQGSLMYMSASMNVLLGSPSMAEMVLINWNPRLLISKLR
ncbi:hypothetical protein LEN26_006565 [Aphanomyces euteiches]|nr:hypothetical protein AeMF1_007959 [Aphanomyces euteiches]KAH9135085.1 hypothetical protein LEN26_006565 [Aphanomyces euteiches]KAH9190489.1 hypothetical protein AeNC1_007546 [Aphanomyces euteiches]